MLNAIKTNSAKSFNFQEEFNLTDEEVRLTFFSELKDRNDLTGFSIWKESVCVVIRIFKARGISDHYPVEVELKTKDAMATGEGHYFFISDSYCIYT